MFVSTQPTVFFRAFSLFGYELSVDNLSDVLDGNISQLIGPHAFGGNISKSRIIELLLSIIFIILGFLFLQFQRNILVNHRLIILSRIESKGTKGMLPGSILKGKASIL